MSLTIDFCKKISKNFESDMVGFASGLPGAEVAQKMLSACYEILVNSKKIKELKDLTTEEKNIIWGTAKDIEAGRLHNNEQMIRLCKCLYVLNYFTTI